ncbi:MAG: substrate-binding domain-containing protein, partial [Bacteroidota bacterium]
EDAKALLASRVDGLLVSITHQTEKYDHFEDFIEAGIPVVFFDKAVESMKNTSRVIVDDRLGAFQAVEHLIGEWCRRIAHFTSPELSYTGKHRLQGYLDAHKRYGIPVDERLIRRCKVVEFEEGYRFALEMLSMEEPPDAIFAVTDEVALGAMTGLKGAGITIPDQVAVMGFSNWKLASVVEPPLSTIAQPGFRIGQESIKLLLKEIQELKKDLPVTYQTMVLPTELIIRESSRRQKTLVNVSNG